MPRKKADAVDAEKKTAKPKTERKPKKKETVVKAVTREPEKGLVDGLADCIVKNPNLINQFMQLGFKPKSPEGMTFREAMICGQIASAVKGDLKSFRAIMDYQDKKDTMPLEDFVMGNGLAMEDLIGG